MRTEIRYSQSYAQLAMTKSREIADKFMTYRHQHQGAQQSRWTGTLEQKSLHRCNIEVWGFFSHHEDPLTFYTQKSCRRETRKVGRTPGHQPFYLGLLSKTMANSFNDPISVDYSHYIGVRFSDCGFFSSWCTVTWRPDHILRRNISSGHLNYNVSTSVTCFPCISLRNRAFQYMFNYCFLCYQFSIYPFVHLPLGY